MNYEDLIVTPWHARFMRRKFPVSIGRAGIGEKQGEGDNITPRGTFRIETWLYRRDRIHSSFRPLNPRDGWSDEACSSEYNQMITRPYSGSHERLYRADPLYDLIGVMDYNRNPVEAGRGSAIFLHRWRRPRYPTEGCIAFSSQDLHFIARNWQSRSRIIIQ